MDRDYNPTDAGTLEGRRSGENYLAHALMGTCASLRAALPERVEAAKSGVRALLTSDDQRKRAAAEYLMAQYAELEKYFAIAAKL
jgi:hypothetical protein